MNLAAQLSANPAAALAALFGAGVLTSLTPCVYPMIPITAAIVGGQTAAAPGAAGGARRPAGRARAALLTLAYVLGLASVYAGLGLFAGLTGGLFGAVSTNPWLYFAMANVLLASGLAMLDVLPVRVPTRSPRARRRPARRGASPGRSRWARCRASWPPRARRR
jgi:thiol:disulfide interchange protein DsbD